MNEANASTENQGIVGDFELGTLLFEAGCATVKLGEAAKATDGGRINRLEASFKETLSSACRWRLWSS
ncbi:hypothetical protein NKI66_32560, partial [Mesorhizobium sp. M0518]